ncbi:Dehydration-responsive element-binding protein 1F [Senna tora]|uniref:Dehydration-responsive element-binding protein 1F n=1 Tax=Senna tora TaxID=362788 RepID=A0A834WHU7_9FABA|nr:Dehydration-responsive element-binding protein 1F [Senna tora]
MGNITNEVASSPCSIRRSNDHGDNNNNNIIVCSSKKKKAGRRKFKETRHPVYRGVRRRNGEKWVCEVREPNKKSRIWLGTYPTPEMAARAHDVAALALKGTSALLNFSDSAFLLPLAASSSAADIRTAAEKAATATIIDQPIYSSSYNSNSNSNNNNNSLFLDEEALYNMPALLDSMAEVQGIAASENQLPLGTHSKHGRLLEVSSHVKLLSPTTAEMYEEEQS